MGLDIVELIMGVEEVFDIEIPDQDAERLETVGAIYDYVWQKLERRQSVPCLSMVWFHRLRRGLIATGDVPRRSVRPATPLESLLPARDRRGRWDELSRSLGRRLPDLELPRPVPRLIYGGACSLLTLSCGEFFTGHGCMGAVGLMGSVLFTWAGFKMAAPLAVGIPQSCATVGLTVKNVLTPGADRPAGGKGWTREEAWEALRGVIVEQLDVRPEDVTPEAHLVYDLGAD